MDNVNKILVIGGSGFVGTRLVNRLVNDNLCFVGIFDKVRSAIFPDLTKIGDVRSLSDLQSSLVDYSIIINLAAEHRDDVKPATLYGEVNIQGAKNICAVACEANIKKIIFTSTVAVYGFSPIGTDEFGAINPFNEYGRTKYEAEKVYRDWQSADPLNRMLVILRPTVIFGERNRGNVFNLFRSISSGSFLMIGSGNNRKSIAYVENVAAFLEFSCNFKPGIHIYNYVDKPDFTMNQFVQVVRHKLGRSKKICLHLPFVLGFLIGKVFDLAAFLTGRDFMISSIRVKKFCANSVYETKIKETGFLPPIDLNEALEKTIHHEFIQKHHSEPLYFTE